MKFNSIIISCIGYILYHNSPILCFLISILLITKYGFQPLYILHSLNSTIYHTIKRNKNCY